MRPGILPEHCFEPKGNNHATLPWFGIKIAQKYAKRDQTKRSSTEIFVATWNPTFSRPLLRQVTTSCTCAVMSRKKCHVSGCRRQVGDVCCLRCLMSSIQPDTFISQRIVEHKNSAIGRHFLEAHGNNNLFKENQCTVLRKCQSKFDCLVYEMLLIKNLKPNLNTLTDSTRAELFV